MVIASFFYFEPNYKIITEIRKEIVHDISQNEVPKLLIIIGSYLDTKNNETQNSEDAYLEIILKTLRQIPGDRIWDLVEVPHMS